MSDELSNEFRGLGKWLSFSVAGLLILLSIPAVFDHSAGAAAGWNIFLGLLLFGAVASDNRRAPIIATIIFAIMIVRLVAAVITGALSVEVGLTALLGLVTGLAAYDLGRQASLS